MIQLPIYEEFAHWLDELFENNDMPEDTKAFCINLYEESAEEHIFGVQLIASGSFDPDAKDGEWACEEVWSCEEDIFTVETDISTVGIATHGSHHLLLLQFLKDPVADISSMPNLIAILKIFQISVVPIAVGVGHDSYSSCHNPTD